MIARLREHWLGRADPLPVAVFRVLFGLELANWWWQLLPHLREFFTDDGLIPRHVLLLTQPDRLTLLALGGDTWQVALFWSAGLLSALALAAGISTRLAALATFVLVSSFEWRDPLVLDGSDDVFRILSLWLVFASDGGRLSLRRMQGGPAATVPALPVRLLEAQVGLIFLASGLEKLGSTLWTAGVATGYVFQLSGSFARPYAAPLASVPGLVAATTVGTVAIELAFLPLILVPARLTRGAAVMLGAALHLGILLALNVGNFPVLMVSTLVLFLPPRAIHAALALGPARAVSSAVARLPSGAVADRREIARLGGAGSAALLALAAVSVWTVVPHWADAVRPPPELDRAIHWSSVDQRWSMFAPDPATRETWIEVIGTLTDGRTVELARTLSRGGAIDAADPLYSRWTKVHERVADDAWAEHRAGYARLHCRRYMAPSADGPWLASVEVRAHERAFSYPPAAPIQRERVLVTRRC